MFTALKYLAGAVVAWLVVTPFLKKGEPEQMGDFDWFGLPAAAFDAKAGGRYNMKVAAREKVDALINKMKSAPPEGGDPLGAFFTALADLAAQSAECEVEFIGVKNGTYMGKSGPYGYGKVTKVITPDANGNAPSVGDWVAIMS